MSKKMVDLGKKSKREQRLASKTKEYQNHVKQQQVAENSLCINTLKFCESMAKVIGLVPKKYHLTQKMNEAREQYGSEQYNAKKSVR